MRDIEARLDVLRNNIKVTELKAVSAPSVTMNAYSEIKTTLSVDVQPNDIIDWLKDEIHPVLIIDGVEYPFGVFAPATYEITDDGIQTTVRVEAYDKCWLMKAMTTDHIIHFNAGTNYLTAVQSLLTEVGISLVIPTSTALTFSTDREDWETGTDFLTIANDLLDEISYNPLWFDAEGYAVLNPKTELTGEPIRTYDFRNIKSMCKNASITVDLFNVPNVFICVCDNPDTGAAMTSTAENNNPTSPMSIASRGKRIVSFNRVNNIASQAALDTYTSNLCYNAMLLGENVEVTTMLMPECGVNETVAIVHSSIRGMCRETGWSAELVAGGEMKHTLEAVSLTVPSEEQEAQQYISAISGIAIAGISVTGKINEY